jgi:predicted transcriptional regulator
MSKFKIRSVKQLEAEMRAVARGERRSPKDAAVQSFNSVDTVLRLLTPENRKLMALIRDKKPGSIAALAQMTGRAAPNLTRTLQKMEAAGLVKMRSVANSKAKMPVAAVKKVRVQIDPYADRDVLEFA